MGSPVPMGWLDAIVDVHFGAQAYVRLDVIASATNTHTPPTPTVSFSLGPKASLVQRLESASIRKIPSHVVNQNYYFVWVTGVPEPTVGNWDTPLSSGGSLNFPYAGQFSVVADINSTGFQAQTWTPGDHLTGTYTTLADATAAANAFNTFVLAHAGPQTITSLNTDGSTFGPIFYTGAYVVHLVVPTTVPEQDTVTLTGRYLLAVPPPSTDSLISVFASGTSASVAMTAAIYTNQATIKSYTQLKGSPDEVATTNAFAPTMTTDALAGQKGHVLFSSGGGGSGS